MKTLRKKAVKDKKKVGNKKKKAGTQQPGIVEGRRVQIRDPWSSKMMQTVAIVTLTVQIKESCFPLTSVGEK